MTPKKLVLVKLGEQNVSKINKSLCNKMQIH